MPERIFKVEAMTKRNAGEALIDIPHFSILRFTDPSEIINTFMDNWGIKPRGVVLPIVHSDGFLFPVKGLDKTISQYMPISEKLKDFQDVVQAFAAMEMDIYLLVDPTMNFLGIPALHVSNVLGDGAKALCIGNPHSQNIIAAVLGTAIDMTRDSTKGLPGKLKGVVFDCVNLWPMGAENNRIKLNCFCTSCEQYFEASSPGLISKFKTFPNPWNLVLKDTGTGISYISDIRPTTTETEIVGLSRQRGYSDVFDTADFPILSTYAKTLIQYVHARHIQTIDAINQIFDEALENLEDPPKRIILVEGAYYDWTSGMMLEDLGVVLSNKHTGAFAEVWFDQSSTALVLNNVDFRSYMWARSRYLIDAFFALCSQAADPVARATTSLARYSADELKEILRSRLEQALGSTMGGKSALVGLSELKEETTKSSGRVGIIGVSLNRDIGEKIVQNIKIAESINVNSARVAKQKSGINGLLEQFLSRQANEE